MKDPMLISIAAIPTLGILAQWIAIRLRFPSILLLLITGFLIGPVFKWVNPDVVMGPVLFPFVSLSVAVILFEGGLTLRIAELKKGSGAVPRLIFLGSAVSWLAISAAAYYVLGVPLQLAVLFGAILLVSGPTVIAPLLRQIKLKPSLGSLLRWEGIIVDPLGASLAILIFEVIVSQRAGDAIRAGLEVVSLTLVAGFGIGIAAAMVMIVAYKKKIIPDYLQETFTFIMVLVAYAVGDIIQSEAGLLVVTVMGMTLANQRVIPIRHIVSFKEHISILLISSLFIVLAARVQVADLLASASIATMVFIASLVVVVRPMSVFLSTWGTSLQQKEKAFLALLYPRGIVAAAVASLFSIRLTEAGFEQAYLLESVTFFTIIITVSFYGLLGRPLVQWLGQKRDQKGVVFVGAHEWARLFAKALDVAQVPIILVDTNIENVIAAKEMGLKTQHCSILSHRIMDELQVSSFGKLLTLTTSDETNLLTCMEYAHFFSEDNIFRIYPKDKKKDVFIKSKKGRFLGEKGLNATYIQSMVTAGAGFKPTRLTEAYTYTQFKDQHPKALPLCFITESNHVKFLYDGHRYDIETGVTLIALRK